MNFHFQDGIVPSIQQLFQEKTYFGLLEGVPNQRMNAIKVESMKEIAKRYLHLDKIYLIPPVEKIWDRPSFMGSICAELPSVVCMAYLEHYQPMRELEKECSQLGLVWWQENYAFPIKEDILKHISTLNWADYAEDAYY